MYYEMRSSGNSLHFLDSRHSHRRKKEKPTAMEHDGLDDVTGVLACHPLTVDIKLLVKGDGGKWKNSH